MFSRKTHTKISYAFLIKFLAGASVFQENITRKISYAFLIKFLAGAFVFQENTPRETSYASLIKFLAGAFVLGSVWGSFGVHLGPCGRSDSNLSW